MILRSYQPEDLQACLKVEEACFKDEQTSFSGFVDMSISHILVAEKGCCVCGYVIFSVVGDESEIFQVAVSPACQKEGVGLKLMQEVVKELDLKSVKQLFLEVRESNRAARGLYSRLGLEEYSVRKAYYSSKVGQPKEDGILYRLSI